MQGLLNPWDNLEHEKSEFELEIETGLRGGRPPIRGPCGASYRSSENYAISSGHQPFVVEIRVASKGLVNKDNHVKCLGTIITHRHILSVGKFYPNFSKKGNEKRFFSHLLLQSRYATVQFKLGFCQRMRI